MSGGWEQKAELFGFSIESLSRIQWAMWVIMSESMEFP